MNLELSFRKTRKWSGYAKPDGSVVKIYLPRFHQENLSRPLTAYFGYLPELEERFENFLQALSWLIVHELCHNLGVQHNKTWTSYEGLV